MSGQGNAGQRIVGPKCRDEGWIGEDDPALTHRGKRNCFAVHQDGAKRARINPLALQAAKSCAVEVHADSLFGGSGIATTH